MKTILAVLLQLGALSAGATEDVVRLGHAPFHTAELKHLLQIGGEYDLEVEELFAPSPSGAISALLAGEVDAAVVPVEQAVSARAAGAPVVVIAGFGPTEEHLVVRKALGAKSVAALAHRRVAVPRGGREELLLLEELRAASLHWSQSREADVQVVYLPPQDLDAALRSAYVDAIVQNDGLTTRAVLGGYGAELPRTARGGRLVLVTTERLQQAPGLARMVHCMVDMGRLARRHGEAREAATPYAIDLGYVDETARRMRALGMRSDQLPPARDFVKLDLVAKAEREWAG